MKKIFIFNCVLVFMFAMWLRPVAAYESVGVDIWAEVTNGGTVTMIAEVNSPLPEKSNISLKDGETKSFHITFNTIGDYSYEVKAVRNQRNIIYDDTVYNVKCYVRDNDGKLSVTTVIYNKKNGKKYEPKNKKHNISLGFCNVKGTSSEVTETKTETPSEDELINHWKGSRPKTGDDTQLDLYLALCIIASAGLFVLSVAYYKACNNISN